MVYFDDSLVQQFNHSTIQLSSLRRFVAEGNYGGGAVTSFSEQIPVKPAPILL